LEKIRRNRKIAKSLTSTGQKFIVHCSEDPYWGTGVPDMQDPRNLNGTYPGCNWHGILLMAVRAHLGLIAAPDGFRWPKARREEVGSAPPAEEHQGN
jgi:hypothetical protein